MLPRTGQKKKGSGGWAGEPGVAWRRPPRRRRGAPGRQGPSKAVGRAPPRPGGPPLALPPPTPAHGRWPREPSPRAQRRGPARRRRDGGAAAARARAPASPGHALGAPGARGSRSPANSRLRGLQLPPGPTGTRARARRGRGAGTRRTRTGRGAGLGGRVSGGKQREPARKAGDGALAQSGVGVGVSPRPTASGPPGAFPRKCGLCRACPGDRVLLGDRLPGFPRRARDLRMGAISAPVPGPPRGSPNAWGPPSGFPLVK